MHLSLSILARPAPTLAWIRVVFELQGWNYKAWNYKAGIKAGLAKVCEVDHWAGMDWEGLDYGP
jgi:hypothetical protein